jgi:hypothetical protein
LYSDLAGYVVFTFGATLISVVLALASWHLWEEHFLKLKKHFEYARKEPETISGRSAIGTSEAS